MQIRRLLTFFLVASTAAAALAVDVTTARADSGSVLAQCTFSNGASQPRQISYDATVPAVVQPGEHFSVDISIDYEVSAGADLGFAFVVVDGAVPDIPFGDAHTTLVTVGPGASSISGTVWFTATGDAQSSVRVGIPRFGASATVPPVTAGETCTTGGLVVGRSWIESPGPSSDPTVSIGDASVSEGTTGTARTVRVPISLSSPSSVPVEVSVSVTGGSAIAGVIGTPDADYNRLPAVKKFRFLPARTGLTPVVKYLPIKVWPDATGEADDTIQLSLSNVTGGYGVRDGVGVVTILDDESASGTAISIGDVSVTEGQSGKRVLKAVVTLNAPVGEDIAFDFNIADATSEATCAWFPGAVPPAGTDCRVGKKAPRVTMKAGTTTKPVAITIYPDSTIEFDETITIWVGSVRPVNVSSPTVISSLRPEATATLVDDD